MVIGVRRCLDNMTTLSAELSRFSSCSKRLQLILDETKRIFNDINESGKSEDGQFFSVELLKEEEQEIVSIAQKPLGIIVLGQNAYCKSKIVNSIFNRTIFPTFDETDNEGNFRLVRFKFGDNLSISLALPDDYDLVNNLEAYKGPWNTIPRKDIEIESNDESDSALDSAVLEVSFNHVLLRQGTRVIVAPSVKGQDTEEIYLKCFDGVSPILIYGYQTETLTQKDLLDLEVLYSASHYQPVCFVKVPLPGQLKKDTNIQNGAPSYLHKHKYDSPLNSNVLDNATQTGADHDTEASHMTHTSKSYEEPQYCVTPPCGYGSTVTVKRTNVNVSSSIVFHQLCELGYLSETADGRSLSRSLASNYYEVDSEIVEDFDQFPSRFMNFAQQVIQMYLVNSSSVLNNSHARCLNMFILSAFDMAREMLITPKKLEFAREKEEELYKSLMKISVEKGDEIKAMISETINGMQEKLIHKAVEYEFLGVEFTENGEILTTKGLKICTYQIQELVLGALNQAIAGNLVKSVDILRDSYTGTLSRCLESLERLDKEQNPEGNTTSKALKQIINAAYQVEIHLQSSYSFIRVLLERMKQLVKSLPWSTQPIIDNEWKAKAAIEMLSSLSEARLARSITSQIKDRLNKSHDAFAVALKQLEQKHSGRLDKIEEERLKLRKVHAPRVAKVALESISLKDVILHGMPQMGREIGRGQYGVVYSCDSWSGFSPCAIKSVVPPDDKHWNDLALEFYYTKNIPEHERIVVLRGSVIDYMYGGGTTPAVLLIMDRLQRDLYAAIKQGLDWAKRLQVSIDVVEGIRYLHSQGLVHRDIKLKNVLLDQNYRGKITDLGFCKPEAMMSGSIVGTPIHMAPELFTGRYDNSVDVYAFGILFWYVCAGHVKLPNAFEQCTNKDQLWTNVKKGLRPEKLATFDSECWELMQECWEGEPMKRPLLGDVETRLKHILMQYRKSAKATSQPPDVKNTNASRRIMPAIPKIMDKR